MSIVHHQNNLYLLHTKKIGNNTNQSINHSYFKKKTQNSFVHLKDLNPKIRKCNIWNCILNKFNNKQIYITYMVQYQ